MPKPKGYNRIELPPHTYKPLPDTLPYTFEVSQLVHIKSNTTWKLMNQVQRQKHPDENISIERFWIDLVYDTLEANIQVTYKSIDNNATLLREYINDAYKLTSQHQVKAYSIEETILITPQGYAASISELSGEVPSHVQFMTTDSTHHFLPSPH